MLILFDNGTPAPLRNALKDHIVVEATERGWDRLTNGDLIAAAEDAGFEVWLTTHKNMRYQQNLKDRKIAFVVIGNQQWPTLRRHIEMVVLAVNAATPGSYAEVDIPFQSPPLHQTIGKERSHIPSR
jgi:hypothetical protein